LTKSFTINEYPSKVRFKEVNFIRGSKLNIRSVNKESAKSDLLSKI